MMRYIKSRGELARPRGFSEITISLQQVHTAHEDSATHEKMTSITSLHLTSSEENIEMGKTRCKADQRDEQKLSSWFKYHITFMVSESLNGSLKAVAFGIIANELASVDSDKAKSIGQEIQKSLDGIELGQPKVKRKDGITAIDKITHGIIVDGKQIIIKPKVLFTRLIGMDYIPIFQFCLR